MRLLVAGDVHGSSNHLRNLFQSAQDRDCVAIYQVGDFGYWEHTPDGVQYIDDVAWLADEFEIPLYFLGGNHDNEAFLLNKYKYLENSLGFIEVRPNVFFCQRGLRWTWDDIKFIALGGAYSVDKAFRLQWERDRSLKIAESNKYRLPSEKKSTDTTGMLWFPGEEMSDVDMDNYLDADRSPVDVIFAHDKPRGSNPRWNRKDYLECYPNQDRLQKAINRLKPKKYIHGHLHYPYTDLIQTGFQEYTWVFGLGCDPGAWDKKMGPYKYEDSWLVLDTRDLKDNEGA